MLYFVLGILFIGSDVGIQLFPNHREKVGAILIAYAVYRFYSTFKKKKQRDGHEG